MNKRIIVLLVMIVGVIQLHGQRKPPAEKPMSKEEIADKKREATDLFKVKRYAEARDILLRLVKYESQNADLNYKLGLCILNSNYDKSKAIEYLEFTAQQKDAPKDTRYYLGLANLHAGAYDAAIEAFDKYKADMKGKPDPKLAVDVKAEWVYNAKKRTQSPVEVTFQNLGKLVNSPGNDYRPVPSLDDSVIFFASNRKGNTGNIPDDFGEGGFTSDVYFFTQNDSGRTKAKNPGMNINSAGYEEPVALSADGSDLYIYVETPEINGDIMRSEQKGKSWQKSVSLGETFVTRDPEYGAAISPNGKILVFSSDKKDKTALGGRDLYICKHNENGSWSTPVNMGSSINTANDEDFPVFFADGKTLFFASNGKESMGGFDIMKTMRADENAPWDMPINIGYPLNTTDDDKYFSLLPDGKTGYISCVKDSSLGGTDLYKYKLTVPLVATDLVVVKATAVVGATGAPTKNARVTILKKSTGATVGEYFTNASTGAFVAVLAPGEYDVAIRTEKLGKFDATLEVPTGEAKIYKIFTLQ